MGLDGGSLAIELVVSHPRKLRLGAVEASLDCGAGSRAALLLNSALG